MTIHPVALVTLISLYVIIQLVIKSSNLSTVDLSPTLDYYFLVQDLYFFCPDTKLSVNEAINNLNERERYILDQRFVIGKTQMEIASELGISQAQISRIEKSAIDNLKSTLK